MVTSDVLWESDHIDSDDLDAVYHMSRLQYEQELSSSPSVELSKPPDQSEPSYIRKHETKSKLAALEAEIRGIDEQTRKLQDLRKSLVSEKDDILKRIQTSDQPRLSSVDLLANRKGKGKAQEVIDYTIEFDWSPQLKARMKKVFHIDNFRLCQQGVCNANLDGRDVVCVMPTGGGKSLTYQLPAILNPGCTLVVSPLISLMTDQILHLREAGIEAVMLTSGTSKGELSSILSRLTAMASSRSHSMDDSTKDIKLCYVTPEKIAKSKTFMSLLQKLVDGAKLGCYICTNFFFELTHSSRIVIDEAHCVSSLGHDFRPDYKELRKLRQYFPDVPILALSATCPPKVLNDILKILQMKHTVDGKAATRQGTVYFSAPLYRKNLHYAVLPKPSSATQVIEAMVEYILEKHRDESGIVYCSTKKDTESVAENLHQISGGVIKAGVYHSEVPDGKKEQLHRQWRQGDVQVVCATIAFGLGIDKGNVRFVLHHTMSKSLDGFYQESGRAGRDGGASDCILYYRPQDATKQSSITSKDAESQAKLYDVLRFVQDLQECRKILFARYFSASADLSMASWTTEESDAFERCGHCDNCLRPPETVIHKNVTFEAWQLLKIVEAVGRQGKRLTMSGLGDLSRGLGGGTFETGGRRQKAKERFTLDYNEVSGGKVGLSKDDTEALIVQLLTTHYMKEELVPTSYNINVYIVPGVQAFRLSRFSQADIANGKTPEIKCSFRKPTRNKAKSTAKSAKKAAKESFEDLGGSGKQRLPNHGNLKKTGTTVKRKRESSNDSDEGIFAIGDEDDEAEYFEKQFQMIESEGSEANDVEEVNDDWSYSLRPSHHSASQKKRRVINETRPAIEDETQQEVISISSG